MRRPCPPVLQTPLLEEQVAHLRDVLRQQDVRIDTANEESLDTWLLPVCAVSPYIGRTLSRFPDLLPALIATGSLLGMPVRGDEKTDTAALLVELEHDLSMSMKDATATDAAGIESIQQKVLRIFRHRHMVRILWCDLTGISALEQTLHELSLLAQCCVKAADQWTFDALCARFGVPCDNAGRQLRLIIIGMGKLGGFELNVSSDIDLICIYPASGNTKPTAEKHKPLDNGEFFRRSVQRVSKLLNSVTAEGFVYRVDTRLRPFGESGPLVMNFDGLENYYLTQARDWERYAMIKGRALCGNAEDIDELEKLVSPFVYRRYLDYHAFDSLRELKRKIALSLLQKQMVDNIKLGSGGIREIEFIGQAFQLVRGGREGRLRIRPIMQVLEQLAQLQLLPDAEVDALLQAYRYLRRVENGVQMMRDEQVHSLPVDEEDQQRLLCMLEEPDWQSFRQTLASHQAKVAGCFAELFESQTVDTGEGVRAQADELEAARDIWAALGAESVTDDDRKAVLSQAGYEADESLLANMGTLVRGSFYQRLTAESQQRVERALPLILMMAKETEQPGATLDRMLSLVRAVAGRGGYLHVLCEQPDALKHLVTLFSKSRWLAGFVAKQPIVIDELLVNTALHTDAESVFSETQDFVGPLHSSDLDVQMDSLRHYKQAGEMRIACAQLDGSLTLMQVSDQLTWLAESIIAGVLSLVRKPLVERYGEPGYWQNDERKLSNVGVLAYGKLGGLELGFGSDLDLVFVHDSAGTKQMTDGDKPIDNTVFYAKLAQKLVHFMSTMTPAGVLYEIDLRLRPNGNSGVLVTGIDTFASYQQSDAWTWEHQALMRARMVFGDECLLMRFDSIRQQILAKARPVEELRLAVANMRERMRAALGNAKPGQMHLKQDAGGVADIEFIVQYLVLAHSRQHPALLMFTDNIRVLDTAEKLALLPAPDCQFLRRSYLDLRERLHRRALDLESALVPLDKPLMALRDSVTALRLRILGEAKSDSD
ncbi:MAG: bifunctional [glutamate--ammonia ligase]-adenylyl-L-tyrosine phosphorylase/[glutamate--ammonia-ligase] adenylyltransferase [Granulosicoccus sp.]